MLEDTQVVIAIDFGTSRSGFAYSFIGDKEAHAHEDWPEGVARYPKTNTHLLYNPDGQVAAWGFEAMVQYAALRQKQQHKGYHFLANFKMALYEKADKVWDQQRLIFKDGQRTLLKENTDDNEPKEFLVLDLIADYLKCIKQFALRQIFQETTGLVEAKQILWCLTVPAIWGDEQKQLMRQAAIQAELISGTSADAERLVIVLEPEAAAIYCSEKDASLKISELKHGSCFMIIDAGGGTIDITVHEVMSDKGQNSLEEVVTGLGGPCGSTYIDKEFREYIDSKLGTEAMQAILDKEPVAYRDMMSNWEDRKCRFSGEKKDYTTFISLPTRIDRLLRKYFPEALQNLAKEQDGIDDHFELDNDTMHELFRPVLDEVEQLVEKQFAHLSSNGRICDFIFLVGGFSTSPLLQQRIHDKFDTRVMRIVVPGEPGAAIELGAVSLGLDPAVVRARRTRLSYGLDYSDKFIPGVDPEIKKILGPNGSSLCGGRFLHFIQAGEKVVIDHSVTKGYMPLHSNDRDMSFGIYASRSPDVRYIDERGVQKIGELRIIRSITNTGDNWRVEATMYFGKSEIHIELRDPASGEIVKTELRFLTTYFPEFIGQDEIIGTATLSDAHLLI